VLTWIALRLPENLINRCRIASRCGRRLFRVLSFPPETVTNRQTLGYALAAGCLQVPLFAFFSVLRATISFVASTPPIGHRLFRWRFASVAIGNRARRFFSFPPGRAAALRMG